MSKIVDQAGLAEALDQITESSVYFATTEDIITPNTRCYTKAEVDSKLGELDQKKLNKEEYDNTLKDIIRVTGYNNIQKFDETKTYYIGDLVKRQIIDEDGTITWAYYRYVVTHFPGRFSITECKETNLQQEIQELKGNSTQETVYLYVKTEGNDVDLSQYKIIYKYNGETHYADISSTGGVEFSILKGLPYTIIFPKLPKYVNQPDMNLFSSTDYKSLEVVYKYISDQIETVIIKGQAIAIGDEAIDAAKYEIMANAKFTIIIDGKDEIIQEFPDATLKVSIDIPIGSTYIIKCDPIQGYIHPTISINSQSSSTATKTFEFKFIRIIGNYGYLAVSKYGKFYDAEQLIALSDTELSELEIVALLFNNSVLSIRNGYFIIPMIYYMNDYIRNYSSYETAQWYESNIQLDTSILPNCGDTSYVGGYFPGVDGLENTKRLRYLALKSTYASANNWKSFTSISRLTQEIVLPDPIVGQTCGEGAETYWVVKDSTLFIIGQGTVPSYNSFSATPWATETIKNIVIGSNITEIGENCFLVDEVDGVTFPNIICLAINPPIIQSTSFRFSVSLQVPDETYTSQRSGISRFCDTFTMPSIYGYQTVPFIGAIQQLAQLNSNREFFQTFYLKWYKAKYGVASSSISYPNSDGFWSSSQANASNACCLYNGRAINYSKTGIGAVVPFFALSPQAVANS